MLLHTLAGSAAREPSKPEVTMRRVRLVVRAYPKLMICREFHRAAENRRRAV